MSETRNKADHLKKHRWLKGQSGNPSGRPIGLVSLTRILNNALEDDHVEIKTIGKGKNKKEVEIKTNYAVLIIMRMLDMAVAQGNDKMINAIWDRIEGKPVQAINLGGQAGNPLEMAVLDEDTMKGVQAMRERWFKSDEKKKGAKVATKRQPSGNQVATKPKKKVVIKKKVKAKK